MRPARAAPWAARMWAAARPRPRPRTEPGPSSPRGTGRGAAPRRKRLGPQRASYAAASRLPTPPVKSGVLEQLHRHAGAGPKHAVRALLTHRDLEVAHAADVHEGLVGPRLPVRRRRRRDVVGVNPH